MKLKLRLLRRESGWYDGAEDMDEWNMGREGMGGVGGLFKEGAGIGRGEKKGGVRKLRASSCL